MSFGIGVGDVFAVSKLARSMWKSFQDSSDQFKFLRTEAANLCLVLDDIAQTVPGRELSEKETGTLSSLMQGCHDILADMNKLLEKNENLGTTSSSSIARTQKAWKKIRWDVNEVNELRSRVTSSTVSLDAFNSSLASKTSQAVKDNLTGLAKRHNQQELQAIIDWLSPLQYPAQQSDIISRRQKGTGQWLLQSDQFSSWLNTTRKTLFCSGIPGAGKTMLAAIVIDHLCNTVLSVDTAVVYIYCNYKMQIEQTPVNLVAGLLKQLLQHQDIVFDDVKGLYTRHLKKGTRPTLDEVFEMLQLEMHRYSQVFVVVDALDECSVENQVRQNLLSKLFTLQTSHNVSLMVTSRSIPEIMQEFQDSLLLEIRASEEDVRKYLDGQMFRLASCVRRNIDLQEAIKESIVKAVDGMFLLAQLHLDSLTDKTSPKAIKKALSNLPLGSNALDQAYDQAMTRIDDQEPGFRQLADQVLAWITHAERPLTIAEFLHALAIESGEPQLDRENITDIEELVSVCVGLVEIDHGTNVIRLVHYTAQEYFRRIRMQRFPNARKDIAAACLTYLSFDVFAEKLDMANGNYKKADESRLQFETRLSQHPFLKYAANHWSTHARGEVEKEVTDLTASFLMNKPKVLNCCQVLVFYPENSYFKYRYIWEAEGISAMHLTALFGLRDTTSLLLEKELEADPGYLTSRSPLSWASQFGHKAVVELLLTRAVEVDSEDHLRRTPLSYAADEGHKAVAEILLTRGAAVNSQGYNYQTPLSFAAIHGHKAVAELLLTRGAAVNSKSYNHQTPLSLAAIHGHEAVAELLLTLGAVQDSKDDNNKTPLSYAAQGGHTAVVELLLAQKVEVDSKDVRKRTPLSYAALGGHKAVVELLLAQRVEVDQKDVRNRTPLSYAALRGHKTVVELLLLTREVEVDSKDNQKRTPLSYAAFGGHEAVVDLLLTQGAAVNSNDDEGQTPLSYAARFGHEAVVKLLLKRGAQINSKTLWGSTPLSQAAEYGHKAVVKLLMTRRVELDSKDDRNRTPLSYATGGGYEDVVELLLTGGVEVDSKDDRERTPLLYAAHGGHQDVMKLLLTRGAEVDSKDDRKRTPLSYAAHKGHEAVVELLCSRGAEVDSKNDNDQTPLSLAVINGCEAVVRLLLTWEVEVDLEDNKNRTPLSYAAEGGHENMVNLLLMRGVEPNSKDDRKRTPLSYAAHEGHKVVAELLLTREAAVDSKNDHDQTPLSVAAVNGHEAVVELLLKRGAEVNSKDHWGSTSLSNAARYGHETVVKLLMTWGADVDSKDDRKQTPLSCAAEGGHKEVVELLLARGVEIDSKDDRKRTPLSYAAHEGHEAVVKLLLAQGAAVDSKNDNDQTPLSVAAMNGHEAVVELLSAQTIEVDSRDC